MRGSSEKVHRPPSPAPAAEEKRGEIVINEVKTKEKEANIETK